MKVNTTRIAIIFGLLFLITLFFSYQNYSDFKKTEALLITEKNKIINDLRASQDSLEVAISENSGLKTELIIERQKVTNLIEEIHNNTIDISSLIKYKNEVTRLKSVVRNLKKEKTELQQRNELLKIQRDSTILVLNDSKKYNEKLKDLNENLHKTIKTGNKISVINLKTATLKGYKNGLANTTNKASKTKILNISFVVVGSKIAKSQEKEYYVQILDENNNVIGDKKSKKFGNKTVDYSYASPVKFNNESLEVSADIEVENVEKGTYFVNVYDKNEIVSNTTFALR